MSETNIHTGVYEQIINRLFKLKLNEVDAGRFYIGKKLISKDDAVHILSKYLQHLIEVAFAGTPDDQDADKYTDFVNSVIKTLGREFNVDDTELDLIDAQKSILTAVVDRTNCEYPDIEQHLKAITPTTSLSRSALFFGGKGPADMESSTARFSVPTRSAGWCRLSRPADSICSGTACESSRARARNCASSQPPTRVLRTTTPLSGWPPCPTRR